MGAPGPILNVQKRVGPPKLPQEAPPPKKVIFFETDLAVIFEMFFFVEVCFQTSFLVELWASFS